MRRTLSAVASLAALVTMTGAQAATPLHALMIKRADLPKSFVRVNAQTLPAPATGNWFPKATDLRDHGYVQSYTAQFTDFGPHPKPLLMKAILQEFADKYGDSDGAQWGYQGRLSGRYRQARRMSLAQVGDESSAWDSVLPESPGKEIEIYFRQDRYVVELHCAGTLATKAQCLHFARIIDNRIRKKG
jgi:hypothetical protein